MTRRLALVCITLAQCGSPTRSVVIPPAPRVSFHEAPFELVLGENRLCIVAAGQLHCRDDLFESGSLTRAKAPAGLESTTVTTASFGADFGCVTTRAGSVECFGANQYGQLGANLREERHDAPIELPNVRDARRVVSGGIHTCAILASGDVSCWGINRFGEAGGDTTYVESARELIEPHVVEGIHDVVDIALSAAATCAVTRDGRTFCWGKVKPDDLRGGRVVPVHVPALDAMSSLSAGPGVFCGVQRERVVCWGRLDLLVPGGTSAEDEAVPIGVDHARRVSVAGDHGCAVDTAGAVHCFGNNDHGALMPPARVPHVPPAIDVLARYGAACAITVRDEVYCWGALHAPEKVTL